MSWRASFRRRAAAANDGKPCRMAVSAKPSRLFCVDDFRAAIAFMAAAPALDVGTMMRGRMKSREALCRDGDHAVGSHYRLRRLQGKSGMAWSSAADKNIQL